MENYLTQREFARRSGLSQGTVNRMVKEGQILCADNNISKIPSSELSRVNLLALKKCKASGTLYIAAVPTEKQEQALKSIALLEEDKGSKYYECINILLASIKGTAEDSAKTTDLGDNFVQMKYNQLVIDEFIKRYLEASKKVLFSLDNYIESKKDNSEKETLGSEFAVFETFPFVVTKELIMFGRVFTEVEGFDENKLSGVSNLLSELAIIMNERCLALSKELSIEHNVTHAALLKRDILDNDFINKKGELYSTFMSKGIYLAASSDSAKKIMEKAKATVAYRGRGSKLKSLQEQGYYIVCFPESGSESELSYIINNGLFMSVMVVCEQADNVNTLLPEEIKLALKYADLQKVSKVTIKEIELQ